MRWVLIRPRNYSPYYDPEMQEPLGLQYLACYLKAAGETVLILDCALEKMDEIRTARRAVSFLPDVIGFSLTTAQELPSVDMIYTECQRIKDHHTHKWIAGGNFVSTEPDHAAKLLPPEMQLVRFEGETAVTMLGEHWQAPSGQSAVHRNDPWYDQRILSGDAVAHLDQLPFPARPFARTLIAEHGVLNIQASRGCCGNCIFCASPGMSTSGKNRWRGRSIPHIVDEIQLLIENYGARSFNFIDEDFLGPNRIAGERGAGFAQEIRRRQLHMTFSIQVRPDSLSLPVIDALAAAGLSYVFMGLETDSQELLKQWHRPSVKDPWQFIQRFRKKDIEVNVGAMLFHKSAALPDIRRLATRLHACGLLDYRSVTNRQVAMPGSSLYNQALRSGEISAEALGPQDVPYADPIVAALYADLLASLAPLGPPAMEAVCALPRAVAEKRLSGNGEQTHARIKRIDRLLRDPVLPTLLVLIEHHEQGRETQDLVARLRQRNFRVAMKGVVALARQIGRITEDELREAIRNDAGI